MTVLNTRILQKQISLERKYKHYLHQDGEQARTRTNKMHTATDTDTDTETDAQTQTQTQTQKQTDTATHTHIHKRRHTHSITWMVPATVVIVSAVRYIVIHGLVWGLV